MNYDKGGVNMKFIGRQRELESLEREYQKDSSFVVIYGRRRVGKTTLIKEFIKGKLAFYFLATEEVESQSIKRLSGVVSRVTQNPLLQRAAFSDWLDLFHICLLYTSRSFSRFCPMVNANRGISLSMSLRRFLTKSKTL